MLYREIMAVCSEITQNTYIQCVGRTEYLWMYQVVASVQAGLGAHPAPYTMGTWSFPGGNTVWVCR